jgi:glycosyltransferase domain-containing protein
MPSLLTVIIPTYNRSEDLARTVRFLRRHSSPFPIIIADGSKDEQASRNAKCQELGENIIYFHVPQEPGEDTWKNYFRRLDRALQQIKTPYAAFCADDDLLVPESAIQSATFLQANPQYVACHGHYLQFEYTGDTIRIPNFEYQSPSIDADEISGRLLQLFSRYEAPFYAVFRIAAMRLLLERCEEPDPPLWPELYHSTAAVIAGKLHRDNTIYCLRNIGNSPHHRVGSTFRSVGEWVADDFDGFLAHYVKYRARALEWAASDSDLNTLHRALDLAFITYIGSEFNSSYWIGRCCETVSDEDDREKLRLRLNQNLSGMSARGTDPTILSAGLDLARAIFRRSILAPLRSLHGQKLPAAIEQRRWTRLTWQMSDRELQDVQADQHYNVEVRRRLIKRFPPEQWNLLNGASRT